MRFFNHKMIILRTLSVRSAASPRCGWLKGHQALLSSRYDKKLIQNIFENVYDVDMVKGTC